MSVELVEELTELARRVAERAGRMAYDGRERVTFVGTKSTETDFVTSMDREVEAFIVESIRRERPNDGFLLEEGDALDSQSGFTWCIDPIDGTTNYLRRLPHYSVSVAVIQNGRCIAGAVSDPTADETYVATESRGAVLNGGALDTSGAASTASSLIGTGFGYGRGLRERQGATVHAVLPYIADLRRPGSAAVALAWVAAGRLDGFWEIGLSPWDYAAGALLVREAGGVVKRWRIEGTDDELLIAGTRGNFDELQRLIRSAERARTVEID